MSEHIKRVLCSKVLWISIILTLIYFFGLKPASNFEGGTPFYAIGYSIPLIVNILIPYFIAFEVLQFDSLFLKFIFFLAISFVMGTNFNLLHLFNYQPTNHDINIMSPLSKSNKPAVGAMDGPSRIKYALFSTWLLQWDKNCKCGYFFEPASLNYAVFAQFNKDIPKEKVNTAHNTYTIYNLDSAVVVPNNHALYQLTITDNKNGQVLLSTEYPKFLYFTIPQRNSIKNDPNYWSHAITMFFNFNIWQKILVPYFTVKTPFELLTKQQWNSLFKQSN